jgi:thioredoxin-related protein
MFISGRANPAVIAFASLATFAAPLSSLSAQEVRFAHDYAVARRDAIEKHRPIVVVLGTENCSWCRKLESTTLRDASVVQALNDRFVVVHIEADRDPSIANALGVSGYPTIVFATPEGKILGKHEGFVDAARFRQQLDRAVRESGPAALAAQPAPAAPAAPPAPALLAVTDPPSRPSRSDDPSAGRLLALAKDDYRAGQLLGCLERCRRIASTYPDAPEAAEAQRLVVEISDDSKTQAAMADMLCEMYLARANTAMAQGRSSEATELLERVRQINPNSALVMAAQSRLAQLRSTEPRIRAQAP